MKKGLPLYRLDGYIVNKNTKQRPLIINLRAIRIIILAGQLWSMIK